ncbi:MAG: metal-dependent transcriptional regulator [Anaerolineae bacterium]|nr:metal-dependent transcriptional regulator [Anaerolineae bacterium]
MRDELTHAVEDYLKTIYDLSLTHGRASTTQIAEVLEIAPASVTGMIKRLSTTRPPLVEYIKHRGVILTPEGERVALEIIRHHRLLELFLYETLGYSWDKVDAEADRLEHVISEEFEARIAEALGDPTHDPHGDPIPDKNLLMPSHAKLSLREMRPDQCGTIQRVRDNDPDLLRYLSEQGIVPQAHFIVTGYTPFDNNITILVDGQPKAVVLGPRITRQIFVEQENG